MSSQRARILLLSTIDTFGGTRTYLENLLHYYQDKHVALYLAGNKVTFQGKIIRTKKQQNFHSIVLPDQPNYIVRLFNFIPMLKIIFDYFSLHHLIKRIKPNLLIVSPFEPTHYFVALFSPIPKILLVHSYPTSSLSLSIRFLIKLIAINQTSIITVSKAALAQLKLFWPDKLTRMAQYIYNPPNFIVPHPLQPQTILTLGHLEWYKDPFTWFDTAEKTLKHFDSSAISFEWRGNGSLKPKLLQKIAHSPYRQQIKIFSPTSNLAQLYSRCYLYFQPSQVESQGIAVLTAQSLGIPCIVSNVGGLPEMVINGQTGIVCSSRNSTTMARAIIQLINDQAQYRQFGRKAKIHASKLASWQKWSQQMTKLHQKFKIKL